MAGIAAALLYAQLHGREVDLVMENDDIVERDLEEILRFGDRAAGFVHEGHGFQQQNTLAAKLAFGNLALKTPPPRREAVAAVNPVDGKKTDIVPVGRVARPGIAEPHEQEHGQPP
jgi:hypothetical protein